MHIQSKNIFFILFLYRFEKYVWGNEKIYLFENHFKQILVKKNEIFLSNKSIYFCQKNDYTKKIFVYQEQIILGII